jgi:alpha-glucosidase
VRPSPLAALLVAAASCAERDPAAPRPDAAVDVAIDLAPAVDAATADRTTPDDLPPAACGAGPLPPWASLDGATLTARCARVELRVTALADGALRLRYAAPGATPPRSWAVVDATDATAATAGATAAGAALCGDGITAQVEPDTCRVRVLDGDGRVLLDDGDAPGWSRAADGSARVERATPAGERFYGFGERNGPLERRGRAMVFYNTDAYDPMYGGVAPTADPLYQSIPFFVGVRGAAAYGVFTDNARRVEVDLAARDPARYAITAAGAEVDQYVLAGPRMADVLRRYTRLTGRAPTPPRWALGYHQCRWGYRDAARLEEVAAGFRARTIPVDAVWLDIQHMDGFRTFTWSPAAFPDPAAMTARLLGAHVHTVVIADPGLKVDEGWEVYRDALAGGHLLRSRTGDLVTGTVWPGRAAFPDFTRGATRAWWGDRVAGLARLGVAGAWLDVNEPTVFPETGGGSVPDETPVDGDGVPTTMAEAHNVYGMLEARATREGLLRAAPDRRPFVLTRAGYAGVQRHAAVWTGDAPSTWVSLRQQLPTLLNLGLSGVAFVGSDVGGYSGRATPELFARWMQLGAVSPFLRGHVTQGVPDQEPWAFGPEVEDIARAQINERMRRMPYLEALFAEAENSGAPVLRPLTYEFPDDAAAARVDDEAMLGPWLLVAPVLTMGASARRVHLPPGRWFEVDSGAVWEGPADVEVGVTLAALPTFVREGAILPRGPLQQYAAPWAATGAPLELDVYPAERATEFTLVDDLPDGAPGAPRSTATFATSRTADGMTLAARVTGDGARLPRALTVRVRRVESAPTRVTLGATELARLSDEAWRTGTAAGWWYDADDRSLVARGVTPAALPLAATYPTALVDPRPTVRVAVEVTVPAGTARDGPVYIATSASGWVHAPLAWDAATGRARGEITVPRGEWFFYKFTRGGWDTVERYADCSEASNRYGFGAAHPGRSDVVATWRDRCP